jgi:hypothetical protein
MPAPTSKAQARFFGAIIGGKVKKKGFSKAEAKNRLRGVMVSKLPARAKKRMPRAPKGRMGGY